MCQWAQKSICGQKSLFSAEFFRAAMPTGRILLPSYCMVQHSPQDNFFNRLPAPPWRLNLTQRVVGTTETLPEESGDARHVIHGVPQNQASIRAITRSARGPARARSRSLNLDSSEILRVLNHIVAPHRRTLIPMMGWTTGKCLRTSGDAKGARGAE